MIKAIVKSLLPAPVAAALSRARLELSGRHLAGLSSQEYWTRHNVTDHHAFGSAEESLRAFRWRSRQYLGYLECMPVDAATGLVVLDYGCGPGHDLVGFSESSQPRRLIGMDVSASSLEQARARLSLHRSEVEFFRIDEADPALPIGNASVDLIHSSGVLHHVPDMQRVLREFRRIVRHDGHCQIMIYNYDSVWNHLYSNWVFRNRVRGMERASKSEVFRMSTDGIHCPISKCLKPDEFTAIAQSCGFECAFVGSAVSTNEIDALDHRTAALRSEGLDDEAREFLYALAFDERNLPVFAGRSAGIDACYRLSPC